MRRRIFLLTALLLPLACPACGGSASRSALKFTAIPNRNTTDLQQRFDPVATWLSRRLGIPVEYVPSADYPASVAMFENGDVQLAWFGGLTGVQARAAIPGARVLVEGAEDRRFKSYFIANTATGIERSDAFPMAMAGKTFTFGSPSSTSGRLMPEHFIRERTGKTPAEFFAGPPGFSGSHDQTARLVASGEVQCGAIDYTVYDQLVQDGRIDPEVCRVVWVSPEFPDYNFTVHPDVDSMFGAGTIDRLQAALIAMKDESLLAAFQRSALVPASNDDFETLETVARSLGMTR